jgi:arsenate reductase (glutaredoxin)
MAAVTIYHNPKCTTSMHAVKVAEEMGVDADIVLYLKTPPDAKALESLIDRLEDPVTDLVRRDANYERLGLTDTDVATKKQVIDTLVKHKELLQRPLIVTPEKVFIGRPKDRVAVGLKAYA